MYLTLRSIPELSNLPPLELHRLWHECRNEAIQQYRPARIAAMASTIAIPLLIVLVPMLLPAYLPAPWMVGLPISVALGLLINWIAFQIIAEHALPLIRLRLKNLCPGCGYDLRASPQVCPECGRPVDKTTAAVAGAGAGGGDAPDVH